MGGRTRVVLYDPNDATHKRVFAGAVSGGLWVNNDITDENSSWTRVGINENLSVTCMAVDPNDSQIMYLGTGEIHSPAQALGNGIWKSTDGGATWSNVYKVRGTTNISSIAKVPGTYYVVDIVVRDKDGSNTSINDSEVFAAIGAAGYSRNPIATYLGFDDYGILKSVDNGTNWNKVTLDIDGESIAPNDFEIGIDNTLWLATRRNVHGKGGGLVHASLEGAIFSLKHAITNARRTEIAVSKQNANTVYVLSRVVTGSGSIAPFVSILKTADAFATSPTILALPNDADTGISANDFTRGQGFYNLMVEVDPTNDAIVYAGGIDLFRTMDSGTSWNQISKWHSGSVSKPYFLDSNLAISTVHADQHALTFHPTNANTAIFGNDGGVYYTTSLSTAASNTSVINERNKDYNVTQFYHAAIGPSAVSAYLLGGTQDNGTQFFNNPSEGINNSERVFGGDGTLSFIDKDGAYMLVTHLYNRIVRFDLPYSSASAFRISSDRSTGSFVNAMDLDENLDILYSNGTNHLARFSDITTNSPIRTNITDALLVNISAVKVSPFTTISSKVFAGTTSGVLVKVENANTNAQIITDISDASFLGSISSIEFGANESEILVTFHNFGVTNVWFSLDGGATWENKEGDLPDFPVKCISMNPLNNNEVIIGTELGVWNTNNFKDTSPKWNQSYNGMSNVAVTSLSLRTSDNTILASSYGRGLYTGKFTGNDITTWTGDIDADWAKTGNWSNGLPALDIDVKIPNTAIKPVLNTAVSVGNIAIETSAQLTLNEQAALTVKEDVTNNGTLIVNSNTINSGSIIVEGNSIGNITYNRAVSQNWHLVSSPVIGQNYDDTWVLENSIKSSPNNPNRKGLGVYDNSFGWRYMLAGESANFIQGKGYTVLRAEAGNITFTGSLPTTSKDVDIAEGTKDAFNLLGNIYPSYIPVNVGADQHYNFLTVNMDALSEQTMWFWDGTSYNAVNHAVSAQFISPGQAFFVSSKSGDRIAHFTTEMQQHQTASFLKSKNTASEIKVSVSLENEKRSTNVFYVNGTSTAFDNGYDSSVYGGISRDFGIYTSLLNEEDKRALAIQSLPKDYALVIPIGLILPGNSNVEIKMSSKNIPQDLNIFLEDKKAGTFTWLENEDSSYRFTSNESINESGRFYLHTLKETLDVAESELSNIKIYNLKQKIYFSGLPAGKKIVHIYSLLGKKILTREIEKSEDYITTEKIITGVYILDIKTEMGNKTKKLFIE